MRTTEVLLEIGERKFVPVQCTSPDIECLARGIRKLQRRGQEPPFTLLMTLNGERTTLPLNNALLIMWKRE